MTDLNRRKALQTTLNDLTQKGIKQGFLTMEDIANAQITGTEHVDAATAYFEAKGIKIIRPEEGNEEKQPPKRRARKRRADRSNEFLYDEDRPEDELTSDGSGEDIVAKITAAQQKKEVSKDELDATTRYLNEIYAFPPLTEAEELPLLLSAKAGDLNARERVINASLRIVVPQARVYLSSATSFQFVDLINEGSIGLMTAIDRFDPSKKTRRGECTDRTLPSAFRGRSRCGVKPTGYQLRWIRFWVIRETASRISPAGRWRSCARISSATSPAFAARVSSVAVFRPPARYPK